MFFARKRLSIFLAISLWPIITNAELPSGSALIIGNGTPGPYLLGVKNIIKNSVLIYNNGVLVSSENYNIGYMEGVLWFDKVIPLSDTMTADFRYLPVSLDKQYYLHEIKPEATSRPAERQKSGGSANITAGDLAISGSKGFSIESGEGEDRLSQSLNLNIEGELVPGLKTSAHISDKSAGGSAVTRRLNELDKIYIAAESKYFNGIFGDFDLVESGEGLMNFRRKLTGLNLKYEKGGQQVRGSAAFFPGDYRRINLAGVDGRLGPYYLTDTNGREGIFVLPGSESIYIDGELLVRGSEKDYTIDYEAGTIQFSPSIILRNESRIAAEYEIAREEYSRSFYAAAGEFSSFGGLMLFSKIIQERDNGNAPKSFEMTSENRELIENAGSESLGAARSGVLFKGAGEGDYVLRNDSLGNQFFEYAGTGLGEYDITFSFIGANLGSYISVGGGVFRYAGPGMGEYEPIILLPIPQLKRYGTVGSLWNSGHGKFNFYGELSGSAFDRNTISDIDIVRTGLSGAAKIDYAKNIINSNAFAGFGIKTRKIGLGMIFPGKVDDIERYRDYDLMPDSSLEGELVNEVTLKGGLDNDRNVSIMFGDLRRAGDFKRNRQKNSINWRLAGPLKISGNLERTSGERIWLKRNGELSIALRNIQPNVTVEYEKRNGESAFRYYEYVGRLPVAFSSDLTGRTELGFRDEKALESYWKDKFRSGFLKQSVSFTIGESGISGEANSSFYKKKYSNSSGSDSEQKSGWTRLTYDDPQERFELKINERLSSSNERLQSRIFIFVGDGNGEYRLEDGEYIKDPEGDYILTLEELGEGGKIAEVSTEFFGVFRPLMFAKSPEKIEMSVGRLIVETDLSYNQKKSGTELVFGDFVPWKKNNLGDLVFRNGRFEMRLFYYPPLSEHRFKYDLIRSYQDGRQYTDETARDYLSSDEVTWSFPAGEKIDFILGGLIAKRERQLNQVSSDLRRHKESVSSEYEFHEFWSLKLGTEYQAVRQKDQDILSKIPSASCGLSRQLGKRSRILATVSYYRVIVKPEGSYIAYQVAEGKREGNNYEADVQARIEPVKNGRFELSYSYDDFAKRPVRQNFRLEFTLLFL